MAAQGTLDRSVRMAILEMYLEERSPDVASVASRLGADASEIAASFDRLAAGRAIVLVPGTHDILMAAPFAGRPTDFRVRVDARSYYANCIWDALGIPGMLAGAGRPSDATIETKCADCAEPLILTVASGSVSATPDNVVAHFGVPAAKWWEDIVFT